MPNIRFISRINRSNHSSFTNLLHNKDGVSALEFALIAPFLILLFYGSVEIAFLMQ